MIAAVFSLLAALAQADDRSPQFRGTGASGVYEGSGIPDSWNTGTNVAWKTVIPGQGWSSPVVWGNRVFVTSLTGPSKVEAPRKGFYGPRMTKTPQGTHGWTVFCLDAKTGQLVWTSAAYEAEPGHPIHVKASYAAETPVTDGEHVYAFFGNVGITCFDMDGKKVWSKPVKARRTRLGWGTGSSPALHQDVLYVLLDSEDDSSLVAIEKRSGKEIWRVKRNEKTSWATPFIWKHEQRTEIVTVATGSVRSYDLKGKLLWSLGGMSSICIPTPVAANGMLYLNSGYEFAMPRPLLAVRPGASGDISLKEGETENEFVAWFRNPGGSYHPSPLVVGDRLYVLYSRGFVACYDAKTGKDIWGPQRLEGPFTASPWAYDGKLYCLNESGKTFVLDGGAEFKVIRSNDLGEMSLATPAVAGGSLYVRTLTTLYCIRKP